jgi:hypothetical protein
MEENNTKKISMKCSAVSAAPVVKKKTQDEKSWNHG